MPPPSHDVRAAASKALGLLAPLLCLAWLGAARPPAPGPAGFKIIVNPANPAAIVTRELVSGLFLKKVSHWESGLPASPVDLVESDPVREAFSQALHSRHAWAVKAYWQQMIFSGRAAPPPELATDEEVVAFVRARPGAIGYVSSDAATEGVKVLEVTGR